MSISIGYKLLEIISKWTNLGSISWSTLHIYFINIIKFIGHFDLLFMHWVSYSRQKDLPLHFCLNSSYVPRTMELDTLVCIINAPMTQHSFIFTSTLSYQKTYTRTRKSRSLSLPHIPYSLLSHSLQPHYSCRNCNFTTITTNWFPQLVADTA